MIVIAGFFVFLSLVAWMMFTLHVVQLEPEQVLAWKPATFVGKFVRWALGRLSTGTFGFAQALVLILGLALMGGLIGSVSWVFGLVPIALTLVLIVEIRRVFEAAKRA